MNTLTCNACGGTVESANPKFCEYCGAKFEVHVKATTIATALIDAEKQRDFLELERYREINAIVRRETKAFNDKPKKEQYKETLRHTGLKIVFIMSTLFWGSAFLWSMMIILFGEESLIERLFTLPFTGIIIFLWYGVLQILRLVCRGMCVEQKVREIYTSNDYQEYQRIRSSVVGREPDEGDIQRVRNRPIHGNNGRSNNRRNFTI